MSDLVLRVCITLAVLGGLLGLDRVPLPGLNQEVLSDPGYGFGALGGSLTVTILGLGPWLAAYVIVELCAVFYAPWRGYRTSGFEGRAHLERAVRFLWLPLCLLQGWALVVSMESFRVGFLPIVVDPGPLFRVIAVLTITAASAAIYGLCAVSARFGLGSGVVLALAVSFLYEPVAWWQWVQLGEGVALTPALLVAAAVVLAAGRGPSKSLGLSVAGLVPAYVVFHGIYMWVYLSPAQGVMAGVVATAALAVVFQMPDLVARVSGVPQAMVQRDLLLGIVVNSIVVGGLIWGLFEVGFPTLGFGLMCLPLILWDLGEEYGARQQGLSEEVWPIHRVYAVQPALDALRAAGVPAAARGQRLRRMLHTFGPFVPVGILTAPEHADDARQVLRRLLAT